MNIAVSMLIMSHLSDAQELLGMCGKEASLNQRINFAKWLVGHYKDTTVEIDANAEWEKFSEKFPITRMAMAAE